MKRAVRGITLIGGLATLFWSRALIGAEQPDTARARFSEPLASTMGAVEVTVTFRGEIPKSSVADDAGTRRDLLRVDSASGGLQGVVAWLVKDNAPRQERSSQTAPTVQAAIPAALMDQHDHEFVPRVLAVRSDQPVKFTNSDPANHNVRSSSPLATNEFNIFTGLDGSYTHRFSADPEHQPIRLGCDIHPWMRGWIYVFENPYFAVTDGYGRLRISGVPPGRYKLHFRQPDVRYSTERSIVVLNAQSVSVRIEIVAESLVKPRE